MSDFQGRSINKKKKFVADGIFNAELNEYLELALKEYGYGGVVVRSSAKKTKIMPKLAASRDSKRVPPQLSAEISRHLIKRFGFQDDSLKIVFDVISTRGLCAAAQCETLKEEMTAGKSVRMCAMKVINNVMKAGKADGCEVVISGKLRQQRAKAMKYKKGYIVSTGYPKSVFVDQAIRHMFMKQGVMGLKVKIMLPYKFDKTKVAEMRGGAQRGTPGGVDLPLPDKVVFHDRKQQEEEDVLPAGVNPTPAQQHTETPQE